MMVMAVKMWGFYLLVIAQFASLTVSVSGELLDIVRPEHELMAVKTDLYILPLLHFETLEPYIDNQTVEVHLLGHHSAYKTKTNAALKEWREEEPDNPLAKDSILNIMRSIQKVPFKYQDRLSKNGGGFINHCFYWSVMSENDNEKERLPTGKLLDDINAAFGSYREFQKKWNETALGIFGSGYVWLIRSPGGKEPNLAITTTANQDSPVMAGLNPILVLDMWEHAWYLKHNFQKANYVKDWWMVVDWERVEALEKWWERVESGEIEKQEQAAWEKWQKAREEQRKEEEKRKEKEEAKKQEL